MNDVTIELRMAGKDLLDTEYHDMEYPKQRIKEEFSTEDEVDIKQEPLEEYSDCVDGTNGQNYCEEKVF